MPGHEWRSICLRVGGSGAFVCGQERRPAVPGLIGQRSGPRTDPVDSGNGDSSLIYIAGESICVCCGHTAVSIPASKQYRVTLASLVNVISGYWMVPVGKEAINAPASKKGTFFNTCLFHIPFIIHDTESFLKCTHKYTRKKIKNSKNAT